MSFRVGQWKRIFPQLHPVFRVGAQEPAQAQQPAEELGDDGGQGRAAHAGVEQADEGDVQHHVQAGAEDQILEGVLPVAHRLHHAPQAVIEHQAQAAGEEDADIGGGEVHHVLGRAHGQRSIQGVKSTPKTVISTPAARLKATLVWMAFSSLS